MELLLQRNIFSDKSTIGQLLVGGAFFCYTLEDKDRQLEVYETPEEMEKHKVYGETAIPRGVYDVVLRNSPRFGVVPWIKNVPAYEWVLIHWGNKPEDTEGCILVGDEYLEDWVSHSKATFNILLSKIEAAIEAGEKITLEVV